MIVHLRTSTGWAERENASPIRCDRDMHKLYKTDDGKIRCFQIHAVNDAAIIRSGLPHFTLWV